MFVIRLPLASITGLSFATIAAAQMTPPGSSATASHPLMELNAEMCVGVALATGWRATIERPVPCTFDLALKLQITRSPFVKLPVVVGATVKPYGFCAPFDGSMAEPITDCFFS